jgi:hypothetical protein
LDTELKFGFFWTLGPIVKNLSGFFQKNDAPDTSKVSAQSAANGTCGSNSRL